METLEHPVCVFEACPFGIEDKFKNARMRTVITVGDRVS